MSVSATYRVEAKLSDTVGQIFDEELTDFDTVSPTWDKEVEEIADFDAETDADGDLNDGGIGVEITFDDANAAYGTMNASAVNQTSGVKSFYIDRNDVAIEDGKFLYLLGFYDGGNALRWGLRLGNNGGVYQLRMAYNDDGGTTRTAGAWYTLPGGNQNIKIMFARSTGVGNDDGYMRLYLKDALVVNSTGHDNDTRDWDYTRTGMIWTNSTTFAGSYYLGYIKVDPIGAPMRDWLAVKNGTYGMAIPVMDTTFRRGDFNNPTAETATMQECWFHPKSITMAEGDKFVLMSADFDTEYEVYLKYTAADGYQVALGAWEDVGEVWTSYYDLVDDWNHIRVYWRASTGAGDDNGSAALYIGHDLKEELTGLDNDTRTVNVMYFGAVADLNSGTYGVLYLDDCKWGPWIDITSDVLEDITGFWGMVDNDPLDLLADTGAMRIVLDNSSGNYLPGLDDALDGFKKGTPVRLRFSYDELDYIRFYGTIDTLEPALGAFVVDKVTIEVTDWMDYAATHPMVSPSIGTDQRADEAITTLVADMPIAPLATDYDTGVNNLPTVFDNVTTKTRAFTELNKIILSELGYCYLIKDPVYGETLVFDNTEARNGLRTPDFTSDNTMTSLEVEYGENVINRFVNKVYPRRVDAAPAVLFDLESRQSIAPGATIIFRGNYSDPDGGGTEVSGKNMVTPVVGTDYDMWTNEDGTGTDIKADLTVGVDKGTEGTIFTLTNGNANVGWVWIRIRGYGVYAYNPIENAAEDDTSIDEFGYKSIVLHQRYKQDLTRGALAGAAILEQEKQPRTRLDKVNFVANRTDALMTAWLTWDVGNMCYLKNTDYNIDEYAYIQGVEFTISLGGLVRFTWVVKGMVSLLLGLSLISCEFDPPVGEDCLTYGYLPHVVNLEYRSYSAWIYVHTVAVGEWRTILGIFGDEAGNVVRVTEDESVRIDFKAGGGAGPFTWYTDNNSLTLNSWVHVVLTGIGSDVSNNDPLIYFDAVSEHLNFGGVGPNPVADEEGVPLFIGNVKTANTDYDWPMDGLIKDVRIFNKNLTAAEVITLEGGGDVDDGLIFQSPCVRTADLDYFEDRTLTAVDRLIDNMYGMIGVPNSSVITRLIP